HGLTVPTTTGRGKFAPHAKKTFPAFYPVPSARATTRADRAPQTPPSRYRRRRWRGGGVVKGWFSTTSPPRHLTPPPAPAPPRSRPAAGAGRAARPAGTPPPGSAAPAPAGPLPGPRGRG